MVSKRIYVDHLTKVNLFSEFSRKDLEKVASAELDGKSYG